MFDPISIIGAVAAPVIGGMFSSGAASSAADTRAASADRASQVQWDMYQQSRQDQMPWLQAGTRGLEQLSAQIEAGPGEFTESPGYKFRREEGEKAILRNRAATGNVASGSTLKAIERYGQDYASNEYDKFLSRYYDRLKPLQSMAGVGQTTAGRMGAEGGAAGRAIGELGVRAGEARASGYIDSANAWTDAAQGGVNALGTIWGNQPQGGVTPAQYNSDPSLYLY